MGGFWHHWRAIRFKCQVRRRLYSDADAWHLSQDVCPLGSSGHVVSVVKKLLGCQGCRNCHDDDTVFIQSPITYCSYRLKWLTPCLGKWTPLWRAPFFSNGLDTVEPPPRRRMAGPTPGWGGKEESCYPAQNASHHQDDQTFQVPKMENSPIYARLMDTGKPTPKKFYL